VGIGIQVQGLTKSFGPSEFGKTSRWKSRPARSAFCSAKERHSAWFRERRSDCLVDLRPGGRCQMDCGTAPMTKAPDVADAPFRCDHVAGGIRRQVTPFGWSRTVIRRRMAPQ